MDCVLGSNNNIVPDWMFGESDALWNMYEKGVPNTHNQSN